MSDGTAYGPDQPYRVSAVCTGNICRSPMAEVLLREAFEEAGLGDRVVVSSAGTTSWEAGNSMDPRTRAALRRHGHDDPKALRHVARQLSRAGLADQDLVLAADRGHEGTLRRMRSADGRADIRLLRSFDPQAAASGDLEMDDPWYGNDRSFDQTYDEIQAAVPGIVAHVRQVVDA